MEQVTVEKLRDSKIFYKESADVSFSNPKNYIDPFLRIIDDVALEEPTVQVQNAIENQNEDGSVNTAYPRFLIQAKVGNNVPDYSSVLGLICALDTGKPFLKVYSGEEASACLNLTIFDADKVFEQGVLGNYDAVFSTADTFLQEKEQEAMRFREVVDDLVNMHLTNEELNREIGRLLRQSKIGSSAIVQGVHRLNQGSSQYYVGDNSGGTKMNLYQSITQSFTDSKEFIGTPNKLVKLAKMFGVN